VSSEQFLTTRNRLAKATGHDKRSRIIREATPAAWLLLGPRQIVPLFDAPAPAAIDAAANSNSQPMKTKPKTLDAAKSIISNLETDLAKANEAIASANVVQPISTAPQDASTTPANVQPAAVAKPPVKTEEDLNLPALTESDLEAEIRGETDYKKRWLLQRSLARLQEKRAQSEVIAKRGRFLGTMGVHRNS